MDSKINITPLTLDHQELLESLWDPLCQNENLQFAEYSFANTYLFRKQHNYQLLSTTPPLISGIEPVLGHRFFIPTSTPENFHPDTLKAASEAVSSHHSSTEECLPLFPIPEFWLQRMNSFHPSMSSFRSETDYLYKVEKLQTLGGRALSSRRNLLHQLEAHHVLESKVLTSNEKNDALAILEQWQQELSIPKETSDYYPCKEALELLDRLRLFGRIAYADGKPIGFTIGGLLTPQTAILNMAKSLHTMKGVTPYLYQDFALHLPESVQWINFEEDLGLPSLRQAKSAYDPDLLLTKWHVKIG